MPTLHIQNLPDELWIRLQNLAIEHDLTLDEAVIYLLEQAFKPNQVEISQAQQTVKALQKIRSRSRVNPAHFGLKDSTELIREDRSR